MIAMSAALRRLTSTLVRRPRRALPWMVTPGSRGRDRDLGRRYGCVCARASPSSRDYPRMRCRAVVSGGSGTVAARSAATTPGADEEHHHSSGLGRYAARGGPDPSRARSSPSSFHAALDPTDARRGLRWTGRTPASRSILASTGAPALAALIASRACSEAFPPLAHRGQPGPTRVANRPDLAQTIGAQTHIPHTVGFGFELRAAAPPAPRSDTLPPRPARPSRCWRSPWPAARQASETPGHPVA